MKDIFSGPNESCIIPGQLEAEFAQRSEQAGGLLFSEKEIEAFNYLAQECGAPPWSLDQFSQESK